MIITYLIISIILGFHWRARSHYFGYNKPNCNFMHGNTIIISALLWPIAILIMLWD